jgi:hypothetical protein
MNPILFLCRSSSASTVTFYLKGGYYCRMLSGESARFKDLR